MMFKFSFPVSIRIFHVDRNLKPKAGLIEIQISNPDGVVCQSDRLNNNDTVDDIVGLFEYPFEFPLSATYGLWNITVSLKLKSHILLEVRYIVICNTFSFQMIIF